MPVSKCTLIQHSIIKFNYNGRYSRFLMVSGENDLYSCNLLCLTLEQNRHLPCHLSVEYKPRSKCPPITKLTKLPQQRAVFSYLSYEYPVSFLQAVVMYTSQQLPHFPSQCLRYTLTYGVFELFRSDGEIGTPFGQQVSPVEEYVLVAVFVHDS